MDGLKASDVEQALSTTEDKVARRILELRKSVSKASTAKYKAFLEARCSDDRLRGMLMYHGAGTGRWAGKLIQPHNFPRGEFSDVDLAIRMFLTGDPEWVDLLYGDVMTAAATCIRGMIVPAAGYDFVCADYSAIEGRVLAYLAGEEKALEVYRSGRDPYKVAATAIYHVPYEEVTAEQRQIGKVAELALGYQGAAGAFRAMAATYGVTVPEEEIGRIVGSWRESRPETTAYWKGLENTCFQAVRVPGKTFAYRNIKMKVAMGFLVLRLPSGRCLWYANPQLTEKLMPWGQMKTVPSFMGVDAVSKKWVMQYLYGGLLAENITQATARDLLVNGMFEVERAGYPVVLHVHDELLAEVPEGFGSVEEFEKLMCTLPDWAEGLPVSADGWRGKRYKK